MIATQQQLKARSAPVTTPMSGGFLQRKCACGNHTPNGGQCGECSKVRSRTLQTNLAAAHSSSAVFPSRDASVSEASKPAEPEAKRAAWAVAYDRQTFAGVPVGAKTHRDVAWDDVDGGPAAAAPTPAPEVFPPAAAPAQAGCIQPTNFTHTNPRDNGVDGIRVDLAWGSSSGNLADLGHCRFREVVRYDPIPNPPFLWNPPNPTIIELAATSGSAIDTHSYPPGLRTGITDPREAGTMTAPQVYQFKCTGAGCSGTWDDIPGQAHTITRQVYAQFVRDNPWRYKVTKTGVYFSREVAIPEP